MVYNVPWSGDDENLVSCSADGTVKIWSAERINDASMAFTERFNSKRQNPDEVSHLKYHCIIDTKANIN